MTDFQAQFEWIEPGILSMVLEGAMTEMNVRALIEDRIRYVDAAGVERYVLLIDTRQVRLTFVNNRLGKAVLESDPRMICACVVGNSMTTQIIASVVGKVSRLPLEYFTRLEAALERARQVVAQRQAAR
ncbi:MAG: hypothetical protein JNM70_03630 [Anaerolineae bacterium]|nr:hypothetical protein [Anaerolineae bacterium]